MAEKDYRRAIEKFKEAVREDSDNIDAYLKLGDILRKEGLAQNAARIHRDLALRTSTDDEEQNKVIYSLALDYWHTDNPQKAETHFKKLLSQNDYKLLVAPYLIKIYEKSTRYKEAIELIQTNKLDRFEKFQTKLVLLMVLEALEIDASGQAKEARIKLKDALKLKPDCVLAVLYIGESYIKEERFEDALTIWTEFCHKYPGKAHVLYPSLEKTYFEQGHFAQIQALYEKIIKEAPDSVPTYKALAAILRKKGDLDTAMSLISDGLSRDADDEVLHSEIFQILYEKGKYKDAAAKAIEIFTKQDALKKIQFQCQKCGFKGPQPFVKCPECGTIEAPVL
jgi:lipopolysaccharide biosynthesis regulator YciM